MDTTLPAAARYPLWARIAAVLGLLWSLFGVFQFANQTFADKAGLIAAGMTAPQAELYSGLPLWMDVVFAIGTIGGSLGCVLLIAGRSLALHALIVSLIAYVALYSGDIIYGVFAAFGASQVAVLTSVVLVAAALVWLARWLATRGSLA